MNQASPLVSVVMAVFNGGPALSATIDSLLAQQGIEFEFIIVNDGSTDDTSRTLEQYAARDSRIRVLEQDNRGLTQSLITGCEQARGKYIARQDAGDVSLGGRLSRQLALIEADPDIVLVSGGTRFLGPKGEELYTVQPDSASADMALRQADADLLRGPPCHPCTLFRADAYRSVGGYRSEFRVAQDLDLWTRMVEKGRHAVVQDTIYEVFLDVNGISSVRLTEQKRTREIIIDCMRARRSGKSEDEYLSRLIDYRQRAPGVKRKASDAAFYYFLGCCLLSTDPKSARKYLVIALKGAPYSPRYWARWFKATLLAAARPG